MAKNSKNPINELKEEHAKEQLKEELKVLFEKVIENKRIKLATVIFTIDDDKDPQVVRKGHFYDSASMINHVMNAYRSRAAIELGL